jgi:transcriptional regulator with XRE-family HTH domain
VECIDNLRVNLRRIRLDQGLTQQGVAERAGIEYKYLQNIEAGRWPNLTLATVQKIADALGVKPWELIYDAPEKEKKQPSRQRGVKRKRK